MIEVKNVSKYYGKKLGVTGLSFTVKKGEIMGLLGPNGSGKSTTMKMLTGYHMPTTGTITIDGHDIVEDAKAATRCIGFMPEIPPLYLEMEVLEYLMFSAAIKGIEKKKHRESVEEVMELAQITGVQNRLIKNLSKGYRQRVGLAQALIGMPEVLILDEPTAGLDPKQIAEVRELLIQLSKDHTIILSSHILSEINMTCEKVIILNKGHVAAVDTMTNLKEMGTDKDRFVIKVRTEEEKAKNIILGLNSTVQVNNTTEPSEENGKIWLEVVGDNSDDFKARISTALNSAGIPILEMRGEKKSLEEVFLNLTEKSEFESTENKDNEGGE